MKFYYEEESGGCPPGVHLYRLYATIGNPETDVWISQSTDKAPISLTCSLLNRIADTERKYHRNKKRTHNIGKMAVGFTAFAWRFLAVIAGVLMAGTVNVAPETRVISVTDLAMLIWSIVFVLLSTLLGIVELEARKESQPGHLGTNG